ncbi:MAG: endonuclease/exonuclease/phosphatase family protein [Cytophagaceae bacterium]
MKNFLLLLALLICIAAVLAFTGIKTLISPVSPVTEILEETESWEINDSVYTIAFYNVENLFDIYDDPRTNDNQFLPEGSKNWTKERYEKKLSDIGKVIEKLGDDNGPEILGLCEVENRKVLSDLVDQKTIKDRNYQIIHFDSPDVRGIDVALIYKENAFRPFTQRAFAIKDFAETRMRTRDILLVGGKVGRDTIFILVNHWPSRIGGEEKTEDKRILVAGVVKSLTDSLKSLYPSAAYLVMGDFNDEPGNASIDKVLLASNHIDIADTSFYNPFYSLYREGRGTYKYRSNWNMLDQIIISGSLIDSMRYVSYKDNAAAIYDPIWLYTKNDPTKGPFKTYSGSKYFGGYSDHLPVYINLCPN